MREVMKISKNYVTDEIITKAAIKDSDSLIGRATIKVLDSEGNLKHEVATENIIFQTLRDWEWYRMSYHDILTGELGLSTYNKTKPFTTLMLTTDDEEESSTKLSIKGDLIGVGVVDVDSAGTHPFKGAYDKVNSFTARTDDGFLHHHRVFEFGNSKANGTFNSLAFTHAPLYASDHINTFSKKAPPFRTARCATLGYANLTNPVDLLYKDLKGDMYVKKSNLYYKVTNLSSVLSGFETVQSDLSHNPNYIDHVWGTSEQHYAEIENMTYTTHKDPGGLTTTFDIVVRDAERNIVDTITFDNIRELVPDFYKYIESCTSTSSSFRAYASVYKGNTITPDGNMYIRFNFATGSSSAEVFPTYSSSSDTLNPSDLSYNSSVIGIFNIYSKQWVLPPRVDSAFCHRLRYYEPNKWASKFTYEGVTYFGYEYASSSKSKLLCTIKPNGDYDPILLGEICATVGYHTNTSSFAFGPMLDEYPGHFVNGYDSLNSTYSFGISRIIPHCTYTKLPSPVTKTNEDTMKIEYDYYIQIPVAFNPNGDHTTMPE